jgi:uncharacterized protein YciI
VELSQYFICLLRKGPVWTAEEAPALQARHIARTRHLTEIGATIAAGPVRDESDIVGFSIFRTATLAGARTLAEADPGVRAGRFAVELHPWLTPAGVLPAPYTETE